MVKFRDRQLKEGEKSHWFCEKCKQDLNQDTKQNQESSHTINDGN